MSDSVDVLVGTVGRAHGLRGEVSVHVSTDEPEVRFARGADLTARTASARPRTVVVRSTRNHAGTLLVTFEGVGDRSAAEGLRGAELWTQVAADEVPPADDEFYDRNLIGLTVTDHTGVTVGRVAEVVHLPAHDSLVVETPTGAYQVPFVSALVPVVDLDAGVVQVADVGGLFGDEGPDVSGAEG